MAKKKSDSLIDTIERTLNLGQYISYKYAWDFIHDLENLKQNIDDLLKEDPERAVRLYEILLHGCTEKIEEMDDSGGDMGMFFEDLFCSWVIARQESKCTPEETLKLIDKWKENDNYGLCYDLEKSLVKVFNKKTLEVFEKLTMSEIDEALASADNGTTYSYNLRHKIEVLKLVFIQKADFKSYIEFAQKIGVTPKDCEEIAKIFQKKKKYSEAVKWVEQGLKLNSKKEHSSSSSYALADMKKELLNKLGNKDEALNMAWDDFKKNPSDFSYRDLMKYVLTKDKKEWHRKAIDLIKDGPLESAIEICVETKEYDILADKILKCKQKSLEDLSHYQTEKAAKVLIKKYPEAAVKVYRALGVRIVNSKKSKYYDVAYEHFEKTKELYQKIGQEKEWEKLAKNILIEHSRKSSFIAGFNDVVSNAKKTKLSFAERASQRWD